MEFERDEKAKITKNDFYNFHNSIGHKTSF